MVKEMWKFLRARKKFWLLPIIVMMTALAVLLVLAETSVVAPFVYSLF
jgi:competence protein ComGC